MFISCLVTRQTVSTLGPDGLVSDMSSYFIDILYSSFHGMSVTGNITTLCTNTEN